MSYDMALSIIQQCRNKPVKAILPFLVGEPLLVPQIFDLISIIRSSTEAEAHLFSNASLLDSEKADRLLQAGLNLLVVTIDGITAETYSRFKRGLPFETVVRNVEEFIRIRNKIRSNCRLRIQFTQAQNHSNLREWPKFREYWQSRINPNRDELVLGWEASWAGRSLGNYRRTQPCSYGLSSCYILSNGDMVTCCLDHLGECVVGNVQDQSIEDIWNGSEMRRIRQIQQTPEIANLMPCKECMVGHTEGRLIKTFRRAVGLGRLLGVEWLDKISAVTRR